jgi:hypothetical protein
LAVLGLAPYLPLAYRWMYPLRTIFVLGVLLVFSRGVIELRPTRWCGSLLVGAAVFAIWIAPDLLFPGYHQHRIFAMLAAGAGPVPVGARHDRFFLLFRIGGSALLVPIVEELFWRAWMMRRLVSPRFERIPLGKYTAESFWLTAVLFASEHGSYWDVGLAAGIAYNWWMLRTRSLPDCILAHAATNACLSVYVLAAGQWQYWL